MRPHHLYLLLNRRHQRKTRLQRVVRPRLRRLGYGAGAVLAVLLMAAIIAGGFAWSSLTRSLPNVEMLPILLDRQDGLLLEPTRLYDRSGRTVLLALENPGIPRRFLPANPDEPGAFDPQLIQYTVSMLDPSFWRHPGFLWQSLLEPEPQTIAETLVQSLLLENEPPGLRRSLRMRLLAAQVVHQYGRGTVLEWYLNSQSFGHLAYGADAAARLYLDQSAADLTLAEVALLLAVREAPALNPLDAPAAALENQQDILRRLYDHHLISTEDYEQARAETLDLRIALQPANPPAPAFTSLVVAQLTRALGTQQVERGGLEIITTLDMDLQRQVTCTLQAQLARLQSTTTAPQECDAARLLTTLPLEPVRSDGLAGAAILLDPTSGQVLAYADTQPTAVRQPGSILTPFVALAGFARGMGPASLVWDIPATLPEELQDLYTPAAWRGPVRLRLALANQHLAPLADLLVELGSRQVWATAAALGLAELNTANPDTLLFEGGDVHLVQVAQAYSTLARLGSQAGVESETGTALQPALFLSAADLDGHPLLDQSIPQTQPVISEPLAYLVHHILADDIARRETLGYPNPLEIGRPAAALLGSSADSRQVWAAGYTPQRVAVVWLGVPDSADDVLSDRAAGALWGALMQYASRDLPATGWTAPAGISTVTVCDPSGLLPTRTCPSSVPEVFLAESVPVAADSLYREYAVNRETGLLATVFTPLALVEERVYLVPPPQAQEWARSVGLPIPPNTYDVIQAPPVQPGVNITAPGLFSAVHGTVSIRGTAAGEELASWSIQVGAGINPQQWVQVGATGEKPVYAGLLASWDTRSLPDGLYAVRLLVVRKDARVESAVIQVTVDNTAPQVEVSYPLAGAEVKPGIGGALILQAQAEDSAGLDRVEWWLDETLAGSRNREEGQDLAGGGVLFSLPWTARTGAHVLVVKVYDLAGNAAESGEIKFTVVR